MQSCKNTVHNYKTSFPHKINKVKAKNERFKQKGIMCEVVSENDFKSSQNLGNGNTKTLKSCIYVMHEGMRMNSGEFYEAGCGNKGCLNPAHHRKRGVTFDLTESSSPTAAPAPAPAPAPTPILDPTSTLRSALRSSTSVHHTKRKAPPKAGCFGSLKCPSCGIELKSKVLAFDFCLHEQKCATS